METIVYRIGSKEYELVLDYPAIQRFENETRKNEKRQENMGILELYELVVLEQRTPKMSDMVKLFWAAARAKNEQWSLELADGLFAERGMREHKGLLEAVLKLLVTGIHDPEAKAEEGGTARPLGPAGSLTPSGG